MKIESLRIEHLKKTFDTSEEETTKFWYERAYEEQEKWRCGKTKVLIDDDVILGYYTLAMQTISLKYGATGYPKDRKVTAILIGQLAVNKDYERKGYSRILLKSSLKDIIEVSKYIGIYVIVVDPLKESLVNFWQKFGFKRFNENSLRMVYPMKTLLSE